jgi:hypothetical protein
MWFRDEHPDYVRLCGELGLDFYVIHDRDDHSDTAVKRRNQKIMSAVQSHALEGRPSLHVYETDIEAQFGQRSHCGLPVLMGLLDGKDFSALSKQWPSLCVPIQEFLRTRQFALSS